MARPKPPQPFLDRRHPRSRGLLLAYPLLNNFGHGTFEVAGRYPGFAKVAYEGESGTPSDRWVHTRWGRSPHFFGENNPSNENTRLFIGDISFDGLRQLTIAALWRLESASSFVEDFNVQTFSRTESQSSADTDLAIGTFQSGSFRLGPIFSLRNSPGNAQSVFRNGTFPNDTWVHAVGVWDGTEMRLYYQGAEVASSFVTGTHRNVSGRNFMIGAMHATSTSDYASLLGDVAGAWLWGRALTAREVVEHYRDPFAMHYPTRPKSSFFAFHAPVTFEDLDGSADATSGATANLSEIQLATGSAAGTSGPGGGGVHQADVPMTLVRAIEGSSDTTSGSAASIIRARGLAGIVAASSGQASALEILRGLVGAAAGMSGHSADLFAWVFLEGSSSVTSGHSANLSQITRLAGASEAASGHAAALDVATPLVGAVAAASGSVALLRSPVPLVGAAAASSGEVTDLAVALALASTVAASSGHSASLEPVRGLVGTAAGESGQVSDLDLGAADLVGSIDATSGADVNLSRVAPLDGSVSAASGAAADLLRLVGLVGAAAANSGSSATLFRFVGLTGTSSASSAAEATATLLAGLIGEVEAESGATARLSLDVSLSGTVVSVSGASGLLRLTITFVEGLASDAVIPSQGDYRIPSVGKLYRVPNNGREFTVPGQGDWESVPGFGDWELD